LIMKYFIPVAILAILLSGFLAIGTSHTLVDEYFFVMPIFFTLFISICTSFIIYKIEKLTKKMEKRRSIDEDDEEDEDEE